MTHDGTIITFITTVTTVPSTAAVTEHSIHTPNNNLKIIVKKHMGRDSAVSIANHNRLGGPGIKSQWG
jgi:hypothetical protein